MKTNALLICLFSTYLGVAQIQVNELSSSNSSTIEDGGQFFDWIELHNTSTETIDLGSVAIGDGGGPAFTLNSSEELLPNAYVLLWASGDIDLGELHLPFKLSSSGESIQLFLNSVLTQEVELPALLPDLSYGLVEGTWKYFDSPTPAASNGNNGYDGYLELTVDQYSAFSTSAQYIKANTTNNEEAELRYEATFAEPDENSSLYSDSLLLPANSTVTLKAFKNGFIPSASVALKTISDESNGLLTVFLQFDPELMFGDNGIYTNFFSGNEVVVDMAYVDDNGAFIDNHKAGLKIHGPDGRAKKSMRLYARGEYGQSRFEYPFFPQRDLDSFKRLILRNAGNDGSDINKSMLRDPIFHQVFSEIDESKGMSAYRPVHLYLNDEYWGVYNLRERQDERFMEDVYGLVDGEVDYLERTAETSSTRQTHLGNWEDYDALEAAAIGLDLSQEDNLAVIENWIDFDNFIDYQLLEIYSCNQDWLSNNLKMYRPTNDPEGKWKWILWDVDWGMGLWYPSYPHGSPDWDALNHALSNWGGWNTDGVVNTELLQNLTESEAFTHQFSSRCADLLNSHLREERVQELRNEMAQQIAEAMERDLVRWDTPFSTWEGQLSVMENFSSQRPLYMRDHFTERFDLGNITQLDLDVSPANAGKIEVNTIVASAFPWDGKYFEEIPVRLKALANPGYVFLEWSDGILADERTESFDDALELTAIYEAVDPIEAPNVVVNEIMYNPSGTSTSEDWIELYNAESFAVDLEGFVLINEDNEPFVFATTIMQPGSFLIVAEDEASFIQAYPSFDSELVGGFDFGLSGNDFLQLENPNGIIIDFVAYEDTSPWPAEADGWGPSIELISPDLDNTLGENWFADPSESGSPGALNAPVGILEETSKEVDFVLFPNPTSDVLMSTMYLTSSTAITPVLYNAIGQQVMGFRTAFLTNGENVVTWNSNRPLNQLPSGTYFFQLRGENGESLGGKWVQIF